MRNDILDLRAVIKKLVPILTKKGLRVTQIGSQAYVRANPKTHQPEIVNIPSVGDNATPEFIMAIQGFIDHEVAHVLLTDFSIYGTDPRRPGGLATKKFVELHNMVEDTMIEREIVKIFPGSKKPKRHKSNISICLWSSCVHWLGMRRCRNLWIRAITGKTQ